MLKFIKGVLNYRSDAPVASLRQPIAEPTYPNLKIIVACHPKSGSTYVKETLCAHFGTPNRILHDSPEVQELSQSKVNSLRDSGFVGHCHILPTKNTLKLIRDSNIQVVVLERALADCLVSMRDMYIERVSSKEKVWRGEHVSTFGIFGPDFLQLSAESQMDYLITNAAPWYLKFTAAWRGVTVDLPKAPIFIRYEEFFADKEAGLAKLVQDLGIQGLGTNKGLSKEDQESKRVRFNVGRVGRGSESLTEHQKAQLWHMAQLQLSNNPHSLTQVLGFKKP